MSLSLVGTEDKGDCLDSERDEVRCLTPALDSHFVPLLHINRDLAADDIPTGQLRLDERQEAGNALRGLRLPREVHVVPLQSRLQKLWVAALCGHLGQFVGPGRLVTLVVPIVEQAHSCVSVLHALFEKDLREDGQLEEVEVQGTH